MSPRFVRKVAAGVFLGLLVGSAFGQVKGTGAPAAGNTGGAIGTTGRSSPTTIPNNNNNNTNSTNITRPLMLTGKVVIDDGSPLPEPAAILRVCNGNAHTEGYTDSSGNFGIQFGNELGVAQDASESGGNFHPPGSMGGPSGMNGTQGATTGSGTLSTDRRLLNCELQAKLNGFRSQSVELAGRQAMDSPDIGTILLHRLIKGEEGNTVSATTLAAPKDARKAFQKGLELARKAKIEDAFRSYQKAVSIYPAYAAAWCELGKIEATRGQSDIARGSFNEALKADPKYVDPYLQLSRLALAARNWQELAQFTGKAIELDSFDYPQEFLFNAVAHYNLHEFEQAEKSILRADTLDTRRQFSEIAHLKGLILLQRKNYAGAAESLRTYLKLAPDAEDAAKVREQVAELDKYVSQTAAQQK